MTPDSTDETLETAEVFSILGNEIRVDIVHALANGELPSPTPFSRLYEAVDLDDSAQFNYHLKKLVPHFVSKREEGYELTSSGHRIARAVLASTFSDIPTLDPFPIDGECYLCGETTLEASYEDEQLTIRCRSCEETVLQVRVPPTVVRGRDPHDVVDAFEQWASYQVQQAIDGICPECGGSVDPHITDDLDDVIQFDAVTVFHCIVCSREVMMSFGSIAYYDDAVQEFYRQREESLEDRRTWEIDQYVVGEHVDIVSRDPWLVRVSFYADGDACHVEIDDTLTVVDAEIVPEGAVSGS